MVSKGNLISREFEKATASFLAPVLHGQVVRATSGGPLRLALRAGADVMVQRFYPIAKAFLIWATIWFGEAATSTVIAASGSSKSAN